MHPQDTIPRTDRPPTFEDRLAAGIDRSGGPDACWPWQRATTSEGYGLLKIGSRTDGSRRTVRAHVAAYRLAYGDPPPDKPCILHTCDNPPCCNPKHLWAGTQADNQADMARKGRTRNQKRTHCPQGHPYDETNTYLYPDGRRGCRSCIRNQSHHRERRWRNG